MGQRTVSSIVDNGTSLAASFNGNTIDGRQARSLLIQAVVSNAAALNGTLAVHASADGLAWGLLGTLTVTITTSGTNLFDITVTSVPFFRLVWTSTAGTGTLTSTVAQKIEG